MLLREGSPVVWLLAIVLAGIAMSAVPAQYLIPALLAEAVGIVLAIGAPFIWLVVHSINRRDDPRNARRPPD